MGKVQSIFTKPLRTFNIEQRTERILSREKPIPAPTYPTVEKQKKLAQETSPNFMEEHYKKDTHLDERLKDLYVTSTDPMKPVESNKDKLRRLLPQQKTLDEPLEYGFYEPAKVAPGKCTLRQAVTFLCDHKTDPVKHSTEQIALVYKMDRKVVENIIKHFRILEHRAPPTEVEESMMQWVIQCLKGVKLLEPRKKKE